MPTDLSGDQVIEIIAQMVEPKTLGRMYAEIKFWSEYPGSDSEYDSNILQMLQDLMHAGAEIFTDGEEWQCLKAIRDQDYHMVTHLYRNDFDYSQHPYSNNVATV